MNKQQWEARENLLNDVCPICKKKFKLKDKFILCPIQEPNGDYIINAIAIPIHTKCYYVKKENAQ